MSKSKILTFIAEGGVRKAVKEFGKEAVKEATEKPAREASIDRLKRIKDIPLDSLSEGAVKAVNKAVVKRNALEKKILNQSGSTPAAKQMRRDLEELTGHLEKFLPNIRKYPTKGIKRPVKKAGGGLAKGARAGKKVAEAIERRAKAANRRKDKAKKAEKKEKRKAIALAGATGATLAGATVIGAKKEKERLEKIKNKKDGGWIQKAIKKPGALKQQLGVPKDEKIPAKKLNAAAKKGGKLGQRARLAKTLRGFKDGGVVTKWENKWG